MYVACVRDEVFDLTKRKFLFCLHLYIYLTYLLLLLLLLFVYLCSIFRFFWVYVNVCIYTTPPQIVQVSRILPNSNILLLTVTCMHVYISDILRLLRALYNQSHEGCFTPLPFLKFCSGFSSTRCPLSETGFEFYCVVA